MIQFLMQMPIGWLIVVMLALVACVLVIKCLLFAWASRRAERLEHLQRSLDQISYPAGHRFGPSKTEIDIHAIAKSLRSEMRSAPR